MKTNLAFRLVAIVLLFPTSVYAALGEQLAKLTPADGAERDWFGDAVAIEGDTALVGSYQDDDNGHRSGSAYLFDVASGAEIAKLTPSDGAVDDSFGVAVGISGNAAIVGAFWDDDNGKNSGSAYLFDVASQSQVAKLTPSDGAAEDLFGANVAISGATAIVSAVFDDDNGIDSGSAYLFDIVSGSQLAKLTPSDGMANGLFGASVSINGKTTIVGAPKHNNKGSAYLFDSVSGAQIAKLTPSDLAAVDWFGGSVDVSGSIAIVGAMYDDDNGIDSGSAYLFDIVSGAQIAKLTPDDGAVGDLFGVSVGICGNTAIVGAYLDDDKGIDSGSAYIFDITTGLQLAKITPSDGAAYGFFGSKIAISGATAIVGVPWDNHNGVESGSAYLFDVVPEPSALQLGVLSAGSILAWKRRPELTI